MPNHSDTQTGARVRAAMKDAGISQYDLAAALNSSQPAIHRRLTGAVDFSVQELRVVADVVNVPVGDLIGVAAAADTNSAA